MGLELGRKQGKKSFSDDAISTIRMNVKKSPDNIAVIFGDHTLTWGEVWERSNRLGNGLVGLGLKPQDRVLIFLPNCMEFPDAILAINKAGCVACACNIRLTGPEVAYQLNDSGAKAIFVQGTQELETILSIKDQAPNLEYIIMVDENAPEGIHSFYGMIADNEPKEPCVETSPNDIHLLMYTSGTTGKPKAAARTYKSDYHMANAVCHEMSLGPDDIYLAVAPMYAAASMGYAFATMMSGGTMAIVPGFAPDQVLAEIEKAKATWTFMVPIMYEWILGMPEEVLTASDISSIRHLASCGAPLHNATAKKIIARFP